MKKFSLLCLLIVGLYPNITQARVCFLADQNCNASTIDTEPVSTLSCPAEYSVSPDQVCEGKIYKECRIEDLNQSLYKDLGCDKDNGYYDINDPNISFYPYVCAETTCENCCNKFKCDTEVFKNCSSPKIGDGDTCEEKDEQYYVNGNSIKFSECNCNTEIYPYNAKNCSGDDYILKGDKCVGDNGTYWTECYNNSCQYTSEYDCESQLENSDCVKDSEGCWNFAGCKQNYAYGKEVAGSYYSTHIPAKCISCNIYSYEDLKDNFITYIGVCPTVWFKADVTTPKSQDSYTTALTTGVNQIVYGENHNLTLDEHYLALGDNSYLENLHIIGENMGSSLLTTYYANNKAHIHNLDILMNSSKHTNTGYVLGGSIYLTGDIKVTMVGDNTTTSSIYVNAVQSSNMQLDKDATLDIEIKNFVNQTYNVDSDALSFDSGTVRIDGTVNINIENMINNRSGGPHAIVYSGGDVVFNGDVNIKMSGIKNPSNYAPKTSAGVYLGIYSGNKEMPKLTFNGKLDMDLEGTNYAIYSDQNVNLILNGDANIVAKNLDKGIVNYTSIDLYKTLSINQSSTKNFFEGGQKYVRINGNYQYFDTILNFASENSHLILSTTSSSNANYSEENFGVKNIKTQAVKDAKWSLDTKHFSTEKRCHTTYDVVDEYYAYPPKEYWSDACEFSTQQECTDVDSNTVCELASDGCWKVTECDEANGWYYSDGVCKPRDCSDYPLDEKAPNSSVYAKDYGWDSSYSNQSTGSANNECRTAGVKKYQLYICGTVRMKTSLYIPYGKIECQPITCSHFDKKTVPANANYYTCNNTSAENPYLIGSCKSGYYFKDGECVKIPDEVCKKNHPLTTCPDGANCKTCYAGSNKYYAITSCKSSTHVFNATGTTCVALTGVTETDYPYAKSADCTAATPTNGSCSSKTVSTSPYVYRYYFSGCKAGYHFDNGKCIANDCSDYTLQKPKTSASYDWGKYASHDSSSCQYGSSSITDVKFLLQKCDTTYKLEGNDCVQVTNKPDEFVSKYRGCGIYDDQYNEYTGSQYDGYLLGSTSSCNKEWYDYIRGCAYGHHWNGTKCIPNNCPDFPFTEKPEHAKTYALCEKGSTFMYRAKSCEDGYRLNNHGCEPIE